jgi:hypothetical protein
MDSPRRRNAVRVAAVRNDERAMRLWSSLVCVVLLAQTTPAVAGSGKPGDASPPNVRIGEAYAQVAVRQSVARASRRLARPECQQLLTEFADAAGRPLRVTLEERGFTAETYFRHMLFYDGTVHPRCAMKDIYAVTLEPGSRFVYVCPARFLDTFRKNPGRAEAYLIHEMLHSLGLGENPPSSREITDRVIDRCRS